ncbi:unnamed protein product [Nyctereutes procyonoides]|uniref:Clusterin n=1 Tax=Nyctereutes procyonoides TaxID=34880 RepID=A0A811YWQ8_NYCPR|nr:unnamed protein product [Nyctereutes procyonoides]
MSNSFQFYDLCTSCFPLLGTLFHQNGWVLGDKAISDTELQEMSTQGSKYINKEIKNALKGVKQVQEEDALSDIKDSETKLKAPQGICNDSMMALWEECKPYLEQTWMKFYTCTCRSGSGLQTHALDIMQDSFNWMSSIMDKIFQDRFTHELQDISTTHLSAQQAMDVNHHRIPYHFLMESMEDNQDHDVCKEICQNSTECLRMKDQCDKCRDILSSYQEKMFNISSLLKQLMGNLSEYPSWLISLKTSDSNGPSGLTKVVSKLFDSDSITVIVPEVSRNNHKFMETVAEKTLQEYCQENQENKVNLEISLFLLVFGIVREE